MQVVPIKLFDTAGKRFMLHDPRVCPGVLPLVEKNKEKPIIQDFYKMFNATYGEKLSKILNITDPDYFFTYWSVYNLCDTFVSDYFDGKALNRLKDAGIDLEAFNKTANDFLFYDIMDVGFGDPDHFIGKMSMSPTALDIVQWMDNRVDHDIHGIGFLGYQSPKLVMYSAHDTTMSAIQNYLKAVFNTSELYYTPFASSIFFELSRKDNFTDFTKLTLDDYSVSVTYNDIPLLNMPYAQFRNNVSNKSLSEKQIADFCGFSTDEAKTDPFLVSTIVLGIVTVGLLGFVVYNYFRSKREEATGYNNISKL